MPSPFYGFGKFPLVPRADTGVFRIDYLRLARNEPPKKIYFLVINIIKVLRAEKALLGHLGYKYCGKVGLSQD